MYQIHAIKWLARVTIKNVCKRRVFYKPLVIFSMKICINATLFNSLASLTTLSIFNTTTIRGNFASFADTPKLETI